MYCVHICVLPVIVAKIEKLSKGWKVMAHLLIGTFLCRHFVKVERLSIPIVHSVTNVTIGCF